MISQTYYWVYQSRGEFQMDWGWGGDGGLNPILGAANVIGKDLNFSGSGGRDAVRGIGFGPVTMVPGLGKVNVPDTVTEEAASSNPSQWSKLTWIWAKFLNSQLPYLPLCEKYTQFEYTSRHWTDWPKPGNSIWSTMAMNDGNGIALALQEGYIHPKP